MNLVDEAIAEDEDLAEIGSAELWDHPAPLAQRGKRIRGRQSLLEDSKGAFRGGLADEGDRLIECLPRAG